MTMITSAVVGGVAAVGSAVISSRAAKNAAKSQSRAAERGIDETRRQFDAATKLFQPYIDAGVGSLAQQQALLGNSGPEAQAQAIANIETGSQFQALSRQGEEAMLQNAAATGGIRGGNTQGALAQFRPQMLNSLIQQQYQNLENQTARGQASAAGQAAQGQQTGANIANLFGQQGAAQAGAQLAQGQAWGGALGSIGNLFGRYKGFQALGMPQSQAPMSMDQMSSLPVNQPYTPPYAQLPQPLTTFNQRPYQQMLLPGS
tara:strand:- start:83 stop:862 length:780 start_codon:yes stop_codon:yes gene_type:complete